MTERAVRRAPSIRARVTTGGLVVFVLALVLGSLLFVGILRTTLVDGVAATAEQSLDTLSSRVEVAGPGAVSDVEDALVQVLDGSGDVLASGEDTGSARLPTSDRAEVVRDGERWLLVSDDLELPSDREGTIIVGASLDDADQAISIVSWLLVAGVPLLAAVMGVVTWLVIGRALRPVDRMRREVDEIESSRLGSRVVEPGSSDEIGRLATTMNRMLGRLEQAQARQQRFVSDASHELRSPLATMRQHAELARAHPDAIELAELSDVMLAEGNRLQQLVDSLLVLTRLDERGAEQADELDLDDLVLEAVARLRDSGTVEVDSSAVGPARVRGDRALLGRAVRNLTDNAARHARSRVTLALAELDGQAVLIVDDDGVGIAEADRDSVFERFVRLDEGRARDAGGSGLGLAIVAAAVTAHRGTVEVSTAPDGGARFVVRLPVEL